MFLVTGASGNVGAEVVRALAREGEPVRALSRTAPAALPPGVTVVSGDLNRPESLRDALVGVRGVFLLPGYQDMPGLLAEVERAGAERVVLLSGTSAASGDRSNAISRYMIDSEDAVHAAGVSWTVVRPSGFMSNALQWAPQIRDGDVVRVPFAGVPVAVIDPYDIAAVVAVALRSPDHAGRVHVVTGPQPLLPAERVAILGDVLGRALRFEAQPDEQARAEMSAAMPAEYVDAFFNFYVDGALDESTVLPTVLDVTGRAPRTFREWTVAHADLFR
ncbi:NmrA family NAD(P)-binding protein [Rugosimonospora africana]|uniref:Nucleotide-diphosphate-sugar epimerase n=1 Tax=Rugosimonospora africana TaxID=556532 RepID=A0A8J3VRI3_9ACTN|nr:NAD(P)H-binding protein [Rugosimonospora africana]GIH15551.1 nucleotide-diphosphate-sugar epimerase [Rugosimonospora africana]